MIKSGIKYHKNENDLFTDVVFETPFNHACLFVVVIDDMTSTGGDSLKNMGIDSDYTTARGFRACHEKAIHAFQYLALGY